MAPKRKKTSVKTKSKNKKPAKAKKTQKRKSKSKVKTRVQKPLRDKKGRFVSTKKFKTKQKSRVSVKKDKRTRAKRKRPVSKKQSKPKVLVKKRQRVTAQRKQIITTKVPFYNVPQGAPEGYSERVKFAAAVHMHASRANRQSPDFALPEAFEKAFIGSLVHTHFEPDEVLIYRFGILIRPRKGMFSFEDREKVSNILSQIPGSSVHYVYEGSTFSLRINLGSPVKGELAGTVSDEIQKQKHILAEIYETIVSEFGDSDWFSFWDTETFIEKSG